jgi:hypothetical protein
MAFGGEILDPATGLEVGRFRVQPLGPAGPLALAGGLEIQTLQLGEGTLFALGAAGGDRALRSYAVIGGTDRFAGARGTCVVREAAGGGPRAALEFTLSLS